MVESLVTSKKEDNRFKHQKVNNIINKFTIKQESEGAVNGEYKRFIE